MLKSALTRRRRQCGALFKKHARWSSLILYHHRRLYRTDNFRYWPGWLDPTASLPSPCALMIIPTSFPVVPQQAVTVHVPPNVAARLKKDDYVTLYYEVEADMVNVTMQVADPTFEVTADTYLLKHGVLARVDTKKKKKRTADTTEIDITAIHRVRYDGENLAKGIPSTEIRYAPYSYIEFATLPATDRDMTLKLVHVVQKTEEWRNVMIRTNPTTLDQLAAVCGAAYESQMGTMDTNTLRKHLVKAFMSVLRCPDVNERRNVLKVLLHPIVSGMKNRDPSTTQTASDSGDGGSGGGGARAKELSQKEKTQRMFHDRLKDLTMPPEVEKVVTEELERLKLYDADKSNSEFLLLRNFLDWLTILPWGKFSMDNLDLNHARKVLDKDHFGLSSVKDRILEFIAIGKLRNDTQHGKIMCFLGPPGVGKTSLGKSVARALGREFARISVGGLDDPAEIKGHRRTYIGALPGKIIQTFKRLETQNPVILIDEIDKMGETHRGSPQSAMLEVLDPEQNDKFVDTYLEVPFDLSKVVFICTANDMTRMMRPLHDRLEVIDISGYVPSEKYMIAKKYIVPQALNDSGLTKAQVKIGDGALRRLVNLYSSEAGVRGLKRYVEQMLRKAAFRVASGEEEVIRVNAGNLSDFVGTAHTDHIVARRNAVGTALGLTVSSSHGGGVVVVETAKNPDWNSGNTAAGGGGGGTGEPRVTVTGQVGDVMQESANIAVSIAQRFLHKIDKKSLFFRNAALNIHLPQGSVKKEGPSAGITLVTALLSLALNVPVHRGVVMTGEVSLNGRVLRVGGIREKTVGARVAKAKYIVLPEANKPDWEEIEANIRAGLIVRFVSTYDEVYKFALLGEAAFATNDTDDTSAVASSSSSSNTTNRKNEDSPPIQ